MKTINMIDTLKASGIAKEWHNGDMHRLYIDLTKADEFYFENNDGFAHGRLALNRRERSNGKLWIDLETGDFSSKSIDNPNEVISQIMEIVRFLSQPETTENTENKEENTMKTYNVTLVNSDCIFDSRSGIETAEEAVAFATGRGGSYIVWVDAGDVTNQIKAKHYTHNESFAVDEGLEEWTNMSNQQFVRYLQITL